MKLRRLVTCALAALDLRANTLEDAELFWLGYATAALNDPDDRRAEIAADAIAEAMGRWAASRGIKPPARHHAATIVSALVSSIAAAEERERQVRAVCEAEGMDEAETERTIRAMSMGASEDAGPEFPEN